MRFTKNVLTSIGAVALALVKSPGGLPFFNQPCGT
jgi:hypothetical protein